MERGKKMERFINAFRIKIRYIDLIKSVLLLFGCIYFVIVLGYGVTETLSVYLFWIIYTIRKMKVDDGDGDDKGKI